MSTPAAQREQNLASIKTTLMPSISSQPAAAAPNIPIIDSHIHLYPASEASTLAWLPPNDPTHPLAGQHSLDEYSEATGTPSSLEGFILVEADRKQSVDAADDPGWTHPLLEVSWWRRLAQGEPRAGEGHSVEQARLCLAAVPWAPVPGGEAAMEAYLQQVAEQACESLGRIRGFRYLVQDKPQGTMLEEKFIESLRWMGRKGYVFDVGVDQHRQGDWVLEEALEMIERAHEGVAEEDKVVFVLNHLCKPDLTNPNPTPDPTTTPSFTTWRTAIFHLSRHPKTYMKLSGTFSETDPAFASTHSPDAIFAALHPWFAVLLATFGPHRLMFGSDWPVCEVGGGGRAAWSKWRHVVRRLCDMASLGVEDQIMIWSGTAIRAYGIEELM